MRILIAEDDLTSRKILTAALTKLGFTVLATCDGQEAWEELEKPDPPRLAIVDWEMPRVDGLQLIQRIRACVRPYYTYIILLTSRGKKEEIVEGISKGADDYVVKPFDLNELVVRINAGQRIITLQQQLHEANSVLEALAKTDPLTGLFNRLGLMQELHHRLADQPSGEMVMSLIMADIDFFKRINDTYGHPAGDEVLRRMAGLLRAEFGDKGIVSRIGGEEFLVLLPGLTAEQAAALAEQARLKIEAEQVPSAGGEMIKLTCSFGVHAAQFCGEIKLEQCMQKADQALYCAKQEGRNQVKVG